MQSFGAVFTNKFVGFSMLLLASCSVEAPRMDQIPPTNPLHAEEISLLNQSLDQVGASIAAHAMLQQFAAQQALQSPDLIRSGIDTNAMRKLTAKFEPSYRLLDSNEAGIRSAAASVDVSAATLGLTDGNQKLVIEVEGLFRQVEGQTEIVEFKGSIKWVGNRPGNHFQLQFATSSETTVESLAVEFSTCEFSNLLRFSSGEEASETEECKSGKLSGRYADGVLMLQASDVELPIGPYALKVSKLECKWDTGSSDSLAIEIAAEIFRDGRNVGYIRGSHMGNGNSSIEAKLTDEIN